MSKETTVLAGHIGVDAGCIWVGDPCYIMGADAPHSVKDWDEYCEKSFTGPNATNPGLKKPFDAPFGEGIGLDISSGFGDGYYPVYVTLSDEGEWGTRVKEVRIVFIDDGPWDDRDLDEVIDELEDDLDD